MSSSVTNLDALTTAIQEAEVVKKEAASTTKIKEQKLKFDTSLREEALQKMNAYVLEKLTSIRLSAQGLEHFDMFYSKLKQEALQTYQVDNVHNSTRPLIKKDVTMSIRTTWEALQGRDAQKIRSEYEHHALQEKQSELVQNKFHVALPPAAMGGTMGSTAPTESKPKLWKSLTHMAIQLKNHGLREVLFEFNQTQEEDKLKKEILRELDSNHARLLKGVNEQALVRSSFLSIDHPEAFQNMVANSSFLFEPSRYETKLPEHCVELSVREYFLEDKYIAKNRLALQLMLDTNTNTLAVKIFEYDTERKVHNLKSFESPMDSVATKNVLHTIISKSDIDAIFQIQDFKNGVPKRQQHGQDASAELSTALDSVQT